MEHFLWVEKYRPQTVKECVLPPDLMKTFQTFVDQENIPTLLLVGPPGAGKTTVAKAMVEEIGADYLFINGSLDMGIDKLRTDIRNFASAMSFTGKRKFVILDEADYLNPNSVQPALRSFMEEFASNCGFILTCNLPQRIIEALHSRLKTISFKFANEDKPQLAMDMMEHLKKMLNAEKVAFDEKVLAQVIIKKFPDMRKIIGDLQTYGQTNGKIDNGILKQSINHNFSGLVTALKNKKYQEVRKWVSENEIDPEFYRATYDNLLTHVKAESVPALVILAADYQYKAAFAADPEINALAYLAEIMVEGML